MGPAGAGLGRGGGEALSPQSLELVKLSASHDGCHTLTSQLSAALPGDDFVE